MLYLVTGVPGAGKTLNTIKMVYDRRIVIKKIGLVVTFIIIILKIYDTCLA